MAAKINTLSTLAGIVGRKTDNAADAVARIDATLAAMKTLRGVLVGGSEGGGKSLLGAKNHEPASQLAAFHAQVASRNELKLA